MSFLLFLCITEAVVHLISGDHCYRWHYKLTLFICVMSHIKHPTEQTTIPMRQYRLENQDQWPCQVTPPSLPPHSSWLLKEQDKEGDAEKQRVFGWQQLK